MVTKIFCDGCRNELVRSGDRQLKDDRVLAIDGSAAGSTSGWTLPVGRFHWCKRCAEIAFQAVQDSYQRRMQDSGWPTTKERSGGEQ